MTVANKVQTLDGRWLSIDGRVLLKAAVAPVVMLPLAFLSWTVILEVESPSAGIEVGDAVIVDASVSVSGSRRITLRVSGWAGPIGRPTAPRCRPAMRTK